MNNNDLNRCYYSDLPSPMAYMVEEENQKQTFNPLQIDRVIEMAWEDRTTFDAIYFQFGLNEQAVKILMKKQLKFGSYKLWRRRVEASKTKHRAKRAEGVLRFKCNLQRNITRNKISKR